MNNLKLFREMWDKTQPEIAKLLKVTPQAYSNYERGTRELDIKKAIILCNHYDCTIQELMGASNIYPQAAKADAPEKQQDKTLAIVKHVFKLTKMDTDFLRWLLRLPAGERRTIINSAMRNHDVKKP